MKTISESVLTKSGTGLDIKVDEWFSHLAPNQKEVTRCENMPKINFVGKVLTIDRKDFVEQYPSFIHFNSATNVVIDFPDLKTTDQWPNTVLSSLSIYKWPSGVLTNIPSTGSESEVIVGDCNLLTSLKGLENLWHLESLTIENCGKLASLTGIPNNCPSLTINDCPKLTDLSAIKDLHLNSLVISNCPGLTSLKGCPDVIEGNFVLTNNSNLTNLDGMPKVVKGTVTIYKNGVSFRTDDIAARCKARRYRIL